MYAISENAPATDLSCEFHSLSKQLAAYGQMAGVRIIPYHDSKLPHFTKLPLAQQKSILNSLLIANKIAQSTLDSGHELVNSKQMVWSALLYLGLKPPAGLFDKIESEDVVDIQNTAGHVFRNFKFYEFCSYTLEELYSFYWTDLYVRNEAIEKTFLGFIQNMFSGIVKDVVKVDYIKHEIQEIFSVFKFSMKHQLRYYAPLFERKTNEVTHFIVIVRASELKPQLTPHQEQILLKNVTLPTPTPL